MSIDTRQLRQALSGFATGVTIVTTRGADGADLGVTANSFNSVSLDPPLILWSLAKSAQSFAAFTAASHFAVHVLASDQEALSTRFAQKRTDKFSGLHVERGLAGVPLLANCVARFQCCTAFRYEGGDHLIIVGEVKEFVRSQRSPLIYHDGRYMQASAWAGDVAVSSAVAG